MRQRSLSATSIKLFLECPQKFYFNYFTDKSKVVRGDSLPFGIAIHASLEEMEKHLEGKGKPTQEDYNHIYKTFIESGVENHLTDQGLYEEGKVILKSRLDAYDDKSKLLGLELRFGAPSDSPIIPMRTRRGTPLTGAIDKVSEYDSETLVITDYKTSKVAMTDEEAITDIQISMYDYVASKLFPKYKHIIIVMDYLRLSPVITHRTEEQRLLFEDLCDAIYARLGEMENEAEFKPRLNTFCGWCDFKKYCSQYEKAIKDPDLKLVDTEELSDSDFVEEWIRVGNVKKVVEDYQRKLKMSLHNRMLNNNGVDVVGDKYTLYRIQRGNVSYDVRKAFELIGNDDFLSLVSVKKASMDKFLSDKPEIAKTLLDSSSISFNDPYFKYKRTK